MTKRKICWITGSNFLDVDIPIIPRLIEKYDITWFIFRQKESWYTNEECEQLIKKIGCNGRVFYLETRLASYESFKQFYSLVKNVKEINADLCYVNYIGIPFLWPLILLLGIDRKKFVYPCHDYQDHVGVKMRRYYVFTKKLIFKTIPNYQFFSRTQRKLFLSDYKDKRTFYAPLALKDFGGEKYNLYKEDVVTFLFFGNIRENKGMHILIEAVNLLYKKYSGKFRVKIAGNCSNWDRYAKLIKTPECYDLDIRRIENDEIPRLFHNAHYLVLPYEDVTQSGPLLISYNYYLPVIASDHDGFKEYIDNGKTGFLFRNLDATDLFRTMEKTISIHSNYSTIKQNLRSFVDKNCSLDSIIAKYENGFDDILNN